MGGWGCGGGGGGGERALFYEKSKSCEELLQTLCIVDFLVRLAAFWSTTHLDKYQNDIVSFD